MRLRFKRLSIILILIFLTGYSCTKKEITSKGELRLAKEVNALRTASIKTQSISKEAEQFLTYYERHRNSKTQDILIKGLSEIADRLSYEDTLRLADIVREEAREVILYRLIRFKLHYGDFYDLMNRIQTFKNEFSDSVFKEDVLSIEKRIQCIVSVSPNKVGVIVPLSGQYKSFGERFIKNIELFPNFLRVEDPEENDLRYISSDGFEFVFKDTQGDENRIEDLVMTLIQNENVIAIIGPVFIQESIKTAYLANKYHVPAIVLSRKDNITQSGKYVFRNCLTNRMQATAIARYAIERLGIERFGIIFPNNSYGVELTNYFWDEVERNHKSVTGVEYYDVDQTTFTAPARKITGKFYPELRAKRKTDEIELPKWAKGLSGARLEALLKKMKTNLPPIIDFDALFIPDYYDKVSLVVPALAYEDVMFTNAKKKDIENAKKILGIKEIRPVQLLGANGWNSEELIRRLGTYAENAIFIDGFFADSPNESARQYVTSYTSRYRTRPNLIDSQFYDTILITLHILRNNKPQNRDDFLKALIEMPELVGSSGILKINNNREILRPLKILTVKEQKIVELDEIRF